MYWILLLGLLSALFAYGQVHSNVTCLPTSKWMSNSLGQDPCLAAAYLQSPCTSESFTISSLLPSQRYSGPDPDRANPCQCSSVVYSLMSACALCQGATFDTWNEWNSNCATVYSTIYPKDIPSQTSVPIWAYMTIEAKSAFNASAARFLASQGIPDRFTSAEPGNGTVSIASPTTSPVSSSSDPKMAKAAVAIIGTVLFILVLGSIAVMVLKLKKYRLSHNERRGIYPNLVIERGPALSGGWHQKGDSVATVDVTMTAQKGLESEKLLPMIITSASQVTLPSMLETLNDEEDSYTPAVESSNMYNDSPVTERVPSQIIVAQNGLPSGCLPPQIVFREDH